MNQDKPRYHHGDLRRELIAVASALLGEGGVEKVDLRGVAGRIGVSQAAIYRHFENKQALVAAILERAFIDLAASLRRALEEDGNGDGYDALVAAYVDFSRRNPWLIRAMFNGLTIDRSLHPDLCAASLGLLDLLAERAAGHVDTDDLRAGAALSWSVMHGLATLLIENQMPDLEADPARVRQMIRAAAISIRSGLAALSNDEG
ncbi:TetR/AcrR family transcriptional regulator [Rhizobiaceae sp. 2RAB30]